MQTVIVCEVFSPIPKTFRGCTSVSAYTQLGLWSHKNIGVFSRDGGLTVMTKYENIMHNRHIIGYHGCADVHQSSSMVK